MTRARFYLAVACFLASAPVPHAQTPPTINVRVSSTNVALGERFRVTLEAQGADGLRFDFPKQVHDGAVEMVAATQPSSRPNEIAYETQLFALGDEARIPELEIRYVGRDGSSGVVRTAAIPLNVITTLDPKEENPVPADYAPPMPVLVSRIFWVAGAALAVLALALLFVIARRLRFPRRPVDPVVTPALSPEEEAFARLDRVASSLGQLDPRAFYIEIIQTLKAYLERRLEAPVLEMTSTESLAFVKAHAWTAPLSAGVRDLVTSADLVKFGGASDVSNAERQIQLVRDVVARVDRLRRAEMEIKVKEVEARKTA